MKRFFPNSSKHILRSLSVNLLFALIIALAGAPHAFAQDTLSVTHTVGADTYAPGENVTVTTTIEYTSTVPLSALGVEVTVPTGWMLLADETGGANPPAIKKQTDNMLEFAWLTYAENTMEFTYTLSVPDEQYEQKSIETSVKYRRGAEPGEKEAQPESGALLLEGPEPPEPPVVEEGELTIALSASGFYVPGENYTVDTQIVYSDDDTSEKLSALGVQVDLPTGWAFVSAGGDDAPKRPECSAPSSSTALGRSAPCPANCRRGPLRCR